MNILFFVGNGFDIALGANTRFVDFYDDIISKLETDNDIFNSIKNDINSWADFEKELCLSYLNKINSKDEQQKFLDDLYEFKNLFSSYLKNENKRVIEMINKHESEFSQVMYDSIYKPSQKIGASAKRNLTNYFNQRSDGNITVILFYLTILLYFHI